MFLNFYNSPQKLTGTVIKCNQTFFEVALPGFFDAKGQTEPYGSLFRKCNQMRIIGLRQVNDLLIIAEIIVAQLRITIQAQVAPDQRIEMAYQKIGQEEGPGVMSSSASCCQPPYCSKPCGPLIRSTPGSIQRPIEIAAGAAIAIYNDDPCILIAQGEDTPFDSRRNFSGRVVQQRRDTEYVRCPLVAIP